MKITGRTVNHNTCPKPGNFLQMFVIQNGKGRKRMSSFTPSTALLHAQIGTCRRPAVRASLPAAENATSRRRMLSAFVATTSLAAGLHGPGGPQALAESWGTRSFLLERFFQPGLSPEDAAARIRQTAEGLHSLRDMLDSMAWRYIIFYIRQKSAYLSQDLKNAASTLPEGRRKAYVKKANELVDNMAEFDYYVRTPKVYESYLYYEKTLKSIDDLVALLA